MPSMDKCSVASGHYRKDLYYYFNPEVEIIKYSGSDAPAVAVPKTIQGNNDLTKTISSYYINNVAEEIILAFDGQRTLGKIVGDFAEKYGDDEAEIEVKVVSVLESIKIADIFQVVYNTEPQYRGISVIVKDSAYPIRASIELTTKCNMACKHCYGSFGSSAFDRITEMEPHKLKKLLAELSNMGVTGVEFTGGEISVYHGTPKAIELAFESGMNSVMLLTNGAILSEELFNTIVKYKDQIQLQVDLHSLNAAYYEWFTEMHAVANKVKENIRRLTVAGVQTAIGSIITPGNRSELRDLVAWVYENGACAMTPTLAIDMGRAGQLENRDALFLSPPQALEFFRELEELQQTYPGFIRKGNMPDGVLRKNCGLLFSHITIAPSGNIKLCTMDMSNNYSFSLGNVFENNIKDIIDENKSFIDALRNIAPPSEEVCTLSCPHYLFCAGCIVRGLHKAHQLDDKCSWHRTLPATLTKYIKSDKS